MVCASMRINCENVKGTLYADITNESELTSEVFIS